MRFRLPLPVLCLLLAAPAGAQNVPAQLDAYLRGTMKLSAGEIVSIAQGEPFVRLEESEKAEAVVFGAQRIRARPEEFVKLYRDFGRLRSTHGYLGVGKIGEPPTESDFKDFTFTESDFKDLKECKPEDCNVQLDMAAIEASRTTEQFVNEMAHVFIQGILQPDALALRRIAAFEAGRNPALGRSYLEHGPAYMAATFAPVLARAAKREGLVIEDVETAIYQLGALISEPLYTEVLLGATPADLAAAIDDQIASGLKAFWRIYGP